MNQVSEIIAEYHKMNQEYFRDNIPEVKRLESLDCLEDLDIIRHACVTDKILLLEYRAKGTSLFPAVRQRLIDAGMAKKHNIIGTSEESHPTFGEVYRIHMGFYNSKLQIHLSIRK